MTEFFPGDVVVFKTGAAVALVTRAAFGNWRVLVLDAAGSDLAKGAITFMSEELLTSGIVWSIWRNDNGND